MAEDHYEGVGVEIEGQQLVAHPTHKQVTQRLDQLMVQIAQEVAPARKAKLKKEALRLMAQESAPQDIVRRLIG